jgi:L-iditol 2-dehydrogenase
MSDTMKAVVMHAPMDMRVEDVPVPSPEPGGMVVRVEACGL